METKQNNLNFGWRSFLTWVSLTVIGCTLGWFLGMAGYTPRLDFGNTSEFVSVIVVMSFIGGATALFQWFAIRHILPHAWAWPVLTVAAWITGYLGLGLYPGVVTSNEVVFFGLVAAWAAALQWFLLRQRFSGGVWWVSLSAVGGGAGWVIGRTITELIPIRMLGRGVFVGIGYGLGLGLATGLTLAFFLKVHHDPAPVGKFSA